MIKAKLTKVTALLLITVMTVCTVNIMPSNVMEVKAAPSTVKDVNLGFGGISDPTSIASTATAWTGSKVYYGNRLWRVLDNSGFLFGDELMGESRYHDAFEDITWENCTLRSYLNGLGNIGGAGTLLGDNFTEIEQSGILISTVVNSDGGNDTLDKLYLLSAAEAQNIEYGFGSDNTRVASRWWRLRSPGGSGSWKASVTESGVVASDWAYASHAVRPAFNLNLSSIFFTSATGAGKSTFGIVGDSNVSFNIWKLTMKDNDFSFAAIIPNTGVKGKNITVNVTSTGSGTAVYNQTSAMLVDSNNTVVAYGKISNDVTTGDKTFTIPSTILAGTYTLKVFQEQVNNNNLTDYVSRVAEESITISEELSTYNVTLASGHNMTKTLTSGAESQTNLSASMTNVIYTANTGYYFPANYNSDFSLNSNGITVARVNHTQIIVSGTPTDNTTITLVAPTEKGTQLAPLGLGSGVERITGTTTAMEYASASDAISWNTCMNNNTSVAVGTWYVRYKETDTMKASTAVEVKVIATSTPVTLPVLITPVTGLTINKSSVNIKAGESVSLSAGTLPANATERSVTWSSSDTSVAVVDENGTVKSVGIGSALITATSNSNTAVTVSCNVKVSIGKVTGLKAEKNTSTSITLTWEKQNNVSGYLICRYDYSKKKYIKVATVKKDSTTIYTDKKRRAATAYIYKVRAYVTRNKKIEYGSYSDILETKTQNKKKVIR